MLVTQIEQAKKREKKLGFEILIETALGMANVEAIAQPRPSASRRCLRRRRLRRVAAPAPRSSAA